MTTQTFYKIIQGDCLDVLPSLDDYTVDLIVTDPPYNIKIDEWDDFQNYLKWFKEWIKKAFLKLKNDGVIWVFCSQLFYPEIHKIISKYFIHRNTIIWRYFNGHVTQKGFSRRYEPIIYATRSDNFVFNADDIRVPRKRLDKRYLDKYNPLGKVPEDVWEINRVVYTPNRLEHPTIKPEKLLERIIKCSSNRGDLILDPFLGSGTTMKVARDLGRSCIGIEINSVYCEMSQKRVFGPQFLDRHVRYEFQEEIIV